MTKENKTEQLQIRVSPAEKTAIQRLAKRAGMEVSSWVLRKLLPPGARRFQALLIELKRSEDKSYTLADIHDLLNKATATELKQLVAAPPPLHLSSYWKNYLAAMVEYAANQKGVSTPAWTHDIKPLEKPHFGSKLENLRLYLLTHSPPPFRYRNIFIDSSIGQRV